VYFFIINVRVRVKSILRISEKEMLRRIFGNRRMEMKSGYKYLDMKHFVLFILQHIRVFYSHCGNKADYGRTRNELDT